MKWTWYADLGNCTLHWAAWAEQGWQASARVSVPILGTPRAAELIEQDLTQSNLSAANCQRAALCVSAPPKRTAVEDVARELLHSVVKVLGADFQADIPTQYHDPAEVGQDRLANAVAAVQMCGAPAVVVDFGSCLTVDAISSEGVFVGGAIAPGLPGYESGLASVIHLREALEEALGSGQVPAPQPGGSTAECLALGTYYGLAGSADRLVAVMREYLGTEAPVIATGGDARRITPLCKTEIAIEPMLTLEGLRLAYERSEA